MSVRSRQSFDDKKDHDYAVEAVDPAKAWDPEGGLGDNGLQRGLKNRHSEWHSPVSRGWRRRRARRGRRRTLETPRV